MTESFSVSRPSTVSLPAGYVDETGRVHVDVQLTPLTGDVEYQLASASAVSVPEFVTTLLARTVTRIGSLNQIDRSLMRELLVDDRDFLMLQLRLMTFGKELRCVVRCPDEACARLMDVTLDLDQFEFEHKRITQRYFTIETSAGNEPRQIEFRLPIGADQEACAELSQRDPAKALTELLARCITRIGSCQSIDAAAVSELGAAISEIDRKMAELVSPLDIEIDATCPECGKHFSSALDVVTFFIDELKQSFAVLENDIHTLAWHYHWPEREILSLMRPRRRRYVTLVQKEIDRLNQVW